MSNTKSELKALFDQLTPEQIKYLNKTFNGEREPATPTVPSLATSTYEELQ